MNTPVRSFDLPRPTPPSAADFVTYARLLALTRGVPSEAAAMAESQREASSRVVKVLRAAVDAGTTTDPQWAGNLIDYQVVASGMADKAAAAATGAMTATQRRPVRALYLVNTWVIPFGARGDAGTGSGARPCAAGPWRSGPRPRTHGPLRYTLALSGPAAPQGRPLGRVPRVPAPNRGGGGCQTLGVSRLSMPAAACDAEPRWCDRCCHRSKKSRPGTGHRRHWSRHADSCYTQA